MQLPSRISPGSFLLLPIICLFRMELDAPPGPNSLRENYFSN